jgi:chromosome segregation ATPase
MTRKKILLFVVSAMILLAPSCVSKKKYLALDSAKQISDSKVLELNTLVAGKNQRIEKMIADFEQMKNELMESNAIKNQTIDSLSGEVNKLARDVNVKESAIGLKENSFEFERRQLMEDLAGQKQLLGRKQSELSQLSGDFRKLKEELSQLTFDLNREKDEKKNLQGNLSVRDAKITEMTVATDKLKSEIQSLKKELTSKNETITRLENNVKLLKKEIK